MGRNTSYVYDPAGNRTTKIDSGVTSTYNYNAANELLTLIPATGAPTTYSYDANGNLTLEKTGSAISTYTWDFENRLTGVCLATIRIGSSPLSVQNSSNGLPQFLPFSLIILRLRAHAGSRHSIASQLSLPL